MEKQLSIKRKRNYKTILLILGLILLCVGGGIAFALLTHQANTSSDDTIQAPAQSVESQAKDTEKDTTVDNFNEVPQYEGESPNELHELTGIISYSAKSDENYSLRISIDQTLGSGTCVLTMTANAAANNSDSANNSATNTTNGSAPTYTATAPIIQSGATTSSCEGFDIPLSELSTSNKWSISIKLTSGEKTGLIVGEASL